MDPTLAYANSDFIPDGASWPGRWANASHSFRAHAQARLDLPYGTAAREAFDLFLPKDPPKGLLIFIHGGYWMASDRKDWSFTAEGAVEAGWAVALPSYTLAPEARISQMPQQIAKAIEAAALMVAGPIVITGHSAGGHLAARMICEDSPLSAATLARVIRVVPISPLADLSPLRLTQMNSTLMLSKAEAEAESPARLDRLDGPEVLIWVGGQERPAFLWQARLLSEEWDCAWVVAQGRHHFDVLEDMRSPQGALTKALIE